MNKERYIRETDSVVPSAEFAEKLLKLPQKHKKKRNVRAAAIIAACLAIAVIAVPAAGMKIYGSKSASDSVNIINEASGYPVTENSENGLNISKTDNSLAKGTNTDKKITRTAQMNIEVKELDNFIRTIKNEVNRISGYVNSENKSVYDNLSSATLVVKVPAQSLDSFIAVIDANGKVTTQQVDTDDISAGYADNEAKIKSLETEQETLLKLLEKAESLDNVIQLQDKLTEIRSQLDYYKSMKKMMDNEVEYSCVTIYANESKRTVRTDGSFFSQVKEKFLNSIYSIGDFLREFAVNFLGAIPYLAIIAVIVILIIIIIKRKKKNNYDE